MNRNCLVSTHSMNHLMDSAGWQALVDQAPSFSPPITGSARPAGSGKNWKQRPTKLLT